MDTLFMALGFILLYIGLPVTIVWLIVRIVKRKAVKLQLILIPSCVVVSVIFIVIGAELYSRTDEYRQQLAEEQKTKEVELAEKEEELKKREKELELKEQELEEKVSITVTPIAEPTKEPTLALIESLLTLPDKYKESFFKAIKTCDMDIQEIGSFEKIEDWSSGERYTFYYGAMEDVWYTLYLYDTGEVASINSMSGEKIYEAESEEVKSVDNKIVLQDGVTGEYGQEDDFSGYKVIRYYLPTGKYTVKCQTRGGGFYIETIEKHIEDGYETSGIVQKIMFSGTDEVHEIEIKDGECVSLLINAKLEFEKNDNK